MSNILKVILIVLIGFISFSTFKEINNKGAKAHRLDCHNKSIVFEHIYDKTILKEVQKLVFSGNYILKSNIELSKFILIVTSDLSSSRVI